LFDHVLISERRHVLDGETDVEAFEHEIECAARSGGSFVEIPAVDHVRRRVLVTPATPVRLERVETEEPVAPGELLFEHPFDDYQYL